MPISLEALKAAIRPEKTALVLGAGASVPSGAPTAAELAAILWKRVANSDPKSYDLTETASILSYRFSRRQVVDVVASTLRPLKPTGGILGLPRFGWPKLFTTNFDTLIESAYAKSDLPIVVIISNYDFTTKENAVGIRLYKIHGSVTEDESLGHKASMLLTEDDYLTHEKYRQALFAQLRSSLFAEGDALIIGQSLRDQHLNDLVREVLAAKSQGAPGTVYVLVYDSDDLRAPLLENKGARICFAGLDEFVHAMATEFTPATPDANLQAVGLLPLSLISSVHDAAAQAALPANTVRMFNGGPATYADISAGTTFERSRTSEIVARLSNGDTLVVVLTGAAGVGKTTFARQILHELAKAGMPAYEHRTDFPFQNAPWANLDAQLRAANQRGVLLLDECTHYLRQTNELVNHLARVEQPALRVLLTANSSQWAPRTKSPNIFARGQLVELSRLGDAEINSLINLLAFNNDIANLVHASFKRLTRGEKFQALRQKCSADMFVCLKNIFANESLDNILLTEYDELDEPLQEYYRYVAALEAVGTKVHRQLLIRMLGLPPERIGPILEGLTGIVEEYDIAPQDGVYGWSTRHVVIARRITNYKFSSVKEISELFETIIRHINPAVQIELQSVRDICDQEFGIGRLGDPSLRQRLYRQLIEAAPGERIPWHRLIRELLQHGGNFEDAEYVIRNAEEAVGADAPIDRYKVRLLLTRAQKTPGISNIDRLAILRRAYEMAARNIERYKWDKISYFMLCEVGVELAQRGESEFFLDEAIEKLIDASNRILDPDMQRQVGHFQNQRARLR